MSDPVGNYATGWTSIGPVFDTHVVDFDEMDHDQVGGMFLEQVLGHAGVEPVPLDSAGFLFQPAFDMFVAIAPQ